MFARVNANNKLEEFIDWNPKGLYPEDIRWVEIPPYLYQWIDTSYYVEDNKVLPPSIDYLRKQVYSKVVEWRKQIEDAGTRLADGTVVATTKHDQDRVDSALNNMERYGIKEVDFKAESSWVKADYATVKAIGQAIVDHVQKCFTLEREHYEALQKLESIEELAKYDYTKDWL